MLSIEETERNTISNNLPSLRVSSDISEGAQCQIVGIHLRDIISDRVAIGPGACGSLSRGPQFEAAEGRRHFRLICSFSLCILYNKV